HRLATRSGPTGTCVDVLAGARPAAAPGALGDRIARRVRVTGRAVRPAPGALRGPAPAAGLTRTQVAPVTVLDSWLRHLGSSTGVDWVSAGRCMTRPRWGELAAIRPDVRLSSPNVRNESTMATRPGLVAGAPPCLAPHRIGRRCPARHGSSGRTTTSGRGGA